MVLAECRTRRVVQSRQRMVDVRDAPEVEKSGKVEGAATLYSAPWTPTVGPIDTTVRRLLQCARFVGSAVLLSHNRNAGYLWRTFHT